LLLPARIVVMAALTGTLLLGGCAAEKKTAPVDQAPAPAKIRIAAVGDFLMHQAVLDSARDPGTGKYDFRGIFTGCRHYLEGPDFTLANLETRLAGPARGYSGFPLFNSPAELAENMRDLGIDLVTTANNHSLDMGRAGVPATLDNLDRAGLGHVGTYRSPGEKKKPALFEVGGIKLGVINYTQDTNGIPVPSDAGWLVNLIERDAMLRDIAGLKEAGCQFLIAYLHFGTEYQRQPNQFQRALARELFEAGVDVVMGSHTHVVQPLEWQRVNVGGREKKVLAAYCLGNFISNQRWRYSDCGIILNLDIVRHREGPPELAGATYTPVWVHTYRLEGSLKYRVLPMEKSLRDYENKRDPLLTQHDYQRLKQAWEDTVGLIGQDFKAVL